MLPFRCISDLANERRSSPRWRQGRAAHHNDFLFKYQNDRCYYQLVEDHKFHVDTGTTTSRVSSL